MIMGEFKVSELKILSHYFTESHFSLNEKIYEENDAALKFFFIVHGSVDLHKGISDGIYHEKTKIFKKLFTEKKKFLVSGHSIVWVVEFLGWEKD